MRDRTADDWTEGPYVKVFQGLQADHPQVWFSDALLAWYVRLLALANQTWPQAPYWPAVIPEAVLATLVETQALDDLGDGRFQVSGLDHLRRLDLTRARAARGWGHQGGIARATTGPRDQMGRYRPAANGTAGLAVVPAEPPAETSSGNPRPPLGPAAHTHTGTDVGTPSEGYLRRRAGARAREVEAQATIRCDDYLGHQMAHRQIDGRWVCPTCEAARAKDGPSFRDLVPPPAPDGAVW